MMLNRSSGTYLHPTPPQTIACSAFYEVAISAKPQHFEFQPHLNGNTARSIDVVRRWLKCSSATTCRIPCLAGWG